MMKIVQFVLIVAVVCEVAFALPANASEHERLDGWYNSMSEAHFGVASDMLRRLAGANYGDGIASLPQLPSARNVSRLAFSSADSLLHINNATLMLPYFAHVVSHDLFLMRPSCPLDAVPVAVPSCDGVFDTQCHNDSSIPFMRAMFADHTGTSANQPREQLNKATAWLDGSFLYTTSEAQLAPMRSYNRGLLLVDPDTNLPMHNNHDALIDNPSAPTASQLQDASRLLYAGDYRANESPPVLALYTLFYRYHNAQAHRIAAEQPHWTDDDVFQAARRNVVGAFQSIVMYEFLPALLGEAAFNLRVPPYSGYNAHLSPAISNEFAVLFDRYLTMESPGLRLRLPSGNSSCRWVEQVGGSNAMRLCQSYWDAERVLNEFSLESVLLGMASQIAENDDRHCSADVLDYFYGPLHHSRTDALAAAIMRGRDLGVAPYKTLRAAYGLEPRGWQQISTALTLSEPGLLAALSILYNGDIDRLDAFVGAMLEPSPLLNAQGSLYAAVVAEQFVRLRAADRFWFENEENGLFTAGEIDRLRRIRLADIIVAATSIEPVDVQRDVFFHRGTNPCPMPQPYPIAADLTPCTPLTKLNYFGYDSAITYSFALVILGLVPIIAWVAACLTLRNSQRARRGAEDKEMKRQRQAANDKQQRLEQFVRAAYARSFHDPVFRQEVDEAVPPLATGGDRATKRVPPRDERETEDTHLTRAEFADALGMREDDLFIRRMFACTARRDKDKISFEEFLSTVHKFTNGTEEERLRLIFDMCDLNQDGYVETDEFCEFMKSLKLSAGVCIDEGRQRQLLARIMWRQQRLRQTPVHNSV